MVGGGRVPDLMYRCAQCGSRWATEKYFQRHCEEKHPPPVAGQLGLLDEPVVEIAGVARSRSSGSVR